MGHISAPHARVDLLTCTCVRVGWAVVAHVRCARVPRVLGFRHHLGFSDPRLLKQLAARIVHTDGRNGTYVLRWRWRRAHTCQRHVHTVAWHVARSAPAAQHGQLCTQQPFGGVCHVRCRRRGCSGHCNCISGGRYTFEKAPSYLDLHCFPTADTDVKTVLPHAKMIFTLCDPVSRLYSEYSHFLHYKLFRPSPVFQGKDIPSFPDWSVPLPLSFSGLCRSVFTSTPTHAHAPAHAHAHAPAHTGPLSAFAFTSASFRHQRLSRSDRCPLLRVARC